MLLSELDLLREPLSASAHTTEEHVRKLESAFSCSKTKSAHVKSEASQMTYIGESNSTPSDVKQLSRQGVKNECKEEKTDGPVDWSHTSCWPCHDPIFISPSWSSAPPGLTLPMGPRPDYWRNELLYRAATSRCSHHVSTEKVEEFTPFCAAASSNRALPTPSCLSEHHLYHFVTWRRRHEHCRQHTQYERSHTETDYVALRRRRSPLGAAFLD